MSTKPCTDQKLLNKLEVLKRLNRPAYWNIKKSVQSVCRKILEEKAEKAFLARDNMEHDILEVDARYIQEFADYLGMYPKKGSYFYCKNMGEDFAAVFVEDDAGHIVDRKFISGKVESIDPLFTFQHYLKPWEGRWTKEDVEFYLEALGINEYGEEDGDETGLH